MEEPQVDPEDAVEEEPVGDDVLDDDELIEQYMAIMSCRTDTPDRLAAREAWRQNRNKG